MKMQLLQCIQLIGRAADGQGGLPKNLLRSWRVWHVALKDEAPPAAHEEGQRRWSWKPTIEGITLTNMR